MAIFQAWSAALYAVANLRSADRPARPASARSRAIRARILSNSFLEVLCFWASLFANNFVQVTLASSHKMLAPLHDRRKEMMLRLHLLAKLFGGIDRGIHFPAQPLLRLTERRRQVSETCSANDHHIPVTHVILPASCRGTVHTLRVSADHSM